MGKLDGKKLVLFINDTPIAYFDEDPFEFVGYSEEYLNWLLKDAVDREDYETAAKIRDYIKLNDPH